VINKLFAYLLMYESVVARRRSSCC